MRFNRYTAVGAAVLATLVLSQSGLSVAQAEDGPTVVFSDPSTVTVEYGQSWQFHAVGGPTAVGVGESYSARAELHGGPSSYVLSTYAQYRGSPEYDTTIDIYPSFEQAALTAGTYTIDAVVTVSLFETGDYGTPATATLVVKPAALGIELRMLTDTSDPRGAIVSARFTGRFIDEYQSSYFPGSAKSPAGEWHIAIKDAGGEIVTESTTERAAGDDVLATSFYWSEAEPGEKYTASAEFVPTGASAANFVITAPQDFAYTAPMEQRPVPTSTATATPDERLAEPTGFGLPLWLLVASGVIIIGLGVLVTLLAVRLRRRGAPISEVSP